MKSADILGRRFNKLTVIDKIPRHKDENGKMIELTWKCQCDCGNIRVVNSGVLQAGRVTACKDCVTAKRKELGKSRSVFIDPKGQRFGGCIVLYTTSIFKGQTIRMCHCKCDCGKEYDANYYNLKNGFSQQCRECRYKESGLKSRVDLTGKVFGELTVIGRNPDNLNWICKCSCGEVIERKNVHYANSFCGKKENHNKNQPVNTHRKLVGMQFGELTVIERLPDKVTETGRRRDLWRCKCSCGKIVDVVGFRLTNGSKIWCDKREHTPKTEKIPLIRRRLNFDQRKEVVLHCINRNMNYSETARVYGVLYRDVYLWVKKYLKDGDNSFIDKRGKNKPTA